MLQPPLKEIRRGDPIPADWLNAAADAAIKSIFGANGIRVQHVGKKILIELDARQIVPP